MNEREVKGIVLEIIAKASPDTDINAINNLNPDVRLIDQLDMDSMDFLDIVMELRKKYRVEVPKEDYIRLATINSCVEYLYDKLPNLYELTFLK